jgi:hypothetical protein
MRMMETFVILRKVVLEQRLMMATMAGSANDDDNEVNFW